MVADSGYYSILGVSENSTEDEIKRAYRQMARELHPDRTGGDAEAEMKFKEVTRAYETLRDPEKRARYDRFGPEGAEGHQSQGGFGPFATGGLGDLFEAFMDFGGQGTRRRSGPPAGSDTEVVVALTLADAVRGARTEVTVEQPIVCTVCTGSGAKAGTSAMRCPDCGGNGVVQRVRQTLLGQIVTPVVCQRCQGLGEAISDPCSQCRGQGRVVGQTSVTVEIPAGVDNGSTLRLTGRGAAGPRGGPAGDLYVHLSIPSDAQFQRHGDDLLVQVHVSMTQAALGATVQLSTFDGDRDLAITPGTQTNTASRIKGLGVPHLRGRGRGDLIAQVVVDTPTEVSKAQEDLLRQLAAERGEEVAPADAGLLSRLRSTFS